MATKSNIRSMRFSDDILQMIEAQIGDTFTQKFENLVTRCVWELPEKEKRLYDLEKEITVKRNELYTLAQKVNNYSNRVRRLILDIERLEETIKSIM